MTADDFRSTADVSCSNCGSGWWVTNPDRLAWDGCEDCAGRGERGTAVVVGLGLFFCLLGLSASVVFYIGQSRGL